MKPLFKILIVSILLAAVFSFVRATADMIKMKDGRELKGIIVEDYPDRLVLSTIDGEITLMKSQIKSLYYDSEEENLVKLGELATERGDYVIAHAYYDKAFRINPNSKKAKEGLAYVQGYLVRKAETLKEMDVARRAEFEEFQYRALERQKKALELEEKMARLRERIGITLKQAENNVKVAEVFSRSPAHKAGIIKGDLIVGVWGRLTGYMEFEKVVDLLLKQELRELKVIIQRTAKVNISEDRGILADLPRLIGASFSMELEGLTISKVIEGGAADRARLEKGDIVVAIDGESTRYMPLKTAIDKIKKSKSKSVNLTIRREAVMWVSTKAKRL